MLEMLPSRKPLAIITTKVKDFCAIRERTLSM